MDGLVSCMGAFASNNQNNAQLSMRAAGLPNYTSQQPIGVAIINGLQQDLPAKKSVLSSILGRQSVGLVHKGLRTRRPCHPIACSSSCGIGVLERLTAQPSLATLSAGVHAYKSKSLQHSDVHRRIYSSSPQTSTGDASVDDSGPDQESRKTVTTALHHISEAGGSQSWLQRITPESLWPYAQLARVDKPTGTWMFAWPCFWSTCLAAPLGSFPNVEMIGLFGLWAFLMRGAACTVNDILDRDFDGKVERTRSRPFPSGTVTVSQGVSFLVLQVLLGLGVTLPLNGMSQLLGAVFVPLFCVYPLLKRVTYWPQAYLGVVINWGIPLGWAAVRGDLSDHCAIFLLYASGILWSIVYDTIYAHQDKEDDKKIGVKSTALLFGHKTRIILTGFSIGSLALLALAGFKCGLGLPFYCGVVVSSGHLVWQLYTVDLDDPADCSSKFRSNVWYGAIVCSAILTGNLAASPV